MAQLNMATRNVSSTFYNLDGFGISFHHLRELLES